MDGLVAAYSDSDEERTSPQWQAGAARRRRSSQSKVEHTQSHTQVKFFEIIIFFLVFCLTIYWLLNPVKELVFLRIPPSA